MRENKSRKSKIRLSKNIIPEHYEIELSPDLEAKTFSGSVVILLSIEKPTKRITLHSKELEIYDVSVQKKEGTFLAQKITIQEKEETVTFFFKKLLIGKMHLSINFKGVLNKHMRGFYESTYTLNKKEQLIATTQFEATDARRCIPCFDEPHFKAVFTVRMIIPDDKEVISNTNISLVAKHSSGMKIVSFAPTPKMSTYLLAFIVGSFEYLESKTKRGVIVRVYTVPEKKQQGVFALETACRCVDFYEKYFGIQYPLKTLDMIALPDFESAAMENWGAITYRESALLVDEKNTSFANKQWVALVVAHEIAHQWFGNLVTMQWWNDLWLNEGFASFIEYLAVDALYPKWNIWNQFVTSDQSVAMSLDQLENTHKIDVSVHHPDEIGEIFDKISYSKGAVVIRQLQGFLGEKNIQEGLRHYLKKHSYKNTTTKDLWDSFSRVSGKDVASFMKNWVGKPGYPFLRADLLKNKLILSQSRFTLLSLKKKDTTLWQIPVSIKTNHESKKILFKKNKESIPLQNPGFIKINNGEVGMYRTLYSEELLKSLTFAIKHNHLSTVDRLGVVRDLHAFLKANMIKTPVVLDFLRALRNEREYIVWIEISSCIKYIYRSISDKDLPLFKLYTQEIFTEVIDYIGFSKNKNETEETVLLRSLLLREVGLYGNRKVIAWAQKTFKNVSEIPADMKSTVYTLVARYGDNATLKKLKAMYRKENNDQEKVRILAALGVTSRKEEFVSLLDFCFSKEVKLQNTTYLFCSLALNPLSRKSTLLYLNKNWKIIGNIEATRRMVNYFVKSYETINDDEEKRLFNHFFDTHQIPQAKRAIAQAKEQIMVNIRFKKNASKEISLWLQKNYLKKK